MKIIEMVKKAKDFVAEKIRKLKYKKDGVTEFAGNEATLEKGELIIPIPKNINFITDIIAQNGQKDGKQEHAKKYSIEDTKRQETQEMGATVEEKIVALIQAIDNLGKNIQTIEDTIVKVTNSPEMKNFLKEEHRLSMTETQIRKENLLRHYYEEKEKMSNNKRRMRGIPMVRRPKRQQYRVRKKKE